MSEVQTEAAPEVIQDDPQALIDRLKEENSRLKNSVSALETKRTEALDETKQIYIATDETDPGFFDDIRKTHRVWQWSHIAQRQACGAHVC